MRNHALVFVTAKIASGFHLYAVDQANLPDGGGGPLPTTITLESNEQLRLIGGWQPIAPPNTHVDEEIWKGLQLREHEGTVTWFAPIELATDIDPATVTIEGQISGQACNPQICTPFDQPFEARQGAGVPLPERTVFTTLAPQIPAEPSEPLSMEGPDQSLSIASAPAYDLSRLQVDVKEDGSLSYYLVLAFAGGLILNIMPCVLPVIGLKVMSFVQQAGQSRASSVRSQLLVCRWYRCRVSHLG